MIEFISFLLTPQYELLQNLQKRNVSIVENHSICDRNLYEGFSYSSKSKYKKNVLIVCTDTMKTLYSRDTWSDKINNAFVHEAAHIAQSCKSGGYMLPLDNRKDIEEEATELEQYPNKVSNLIKKYCRVK